MITVVIPNADYEQWANEIPCGMKTLKKLRDAGIPAIGALSVRGVEHGSITIERIGDMHHFTWDPKVRVSEVKQEDEW